MHSVKFVVFICLFFFLLQLCFCCRSKRFSFFTWSYICQFCKKYNTLNSFLLLFTIWKEEWLVSFMTFSVCPPVFTFQARVRAVLQKGETKRITQSANHLPAGTAWSPVPSFVVISKLTVMCCYLKKFNFALTWKVLLLRQVKWVRITFKIRARAKPTPKLTVRPVDQLRHYCRILRMWSFMKNVHL